MNDIYENVEEYNPGKERKILIAFYMIVDILSNKKHNSIATELFIKGRKLSISLLLLHNLTLLYQRTYQRRLFEYLQKICWKTIFFFSDRYYSFIR